MDGKQSKTGGRASGSNRYQKSSVTCKPLLRPKQQINQVEYDSEDEPFAFPVKNDFVAVKINGTATKMLVDFDITWQFYNLVKSARSAFLGRK